MNWMSCGTLWEGDSSRGSLWKDECNSWWKSKQWDFVPKRTALKEALFSLHLIGLAISSNLTAWVKTGTRGRGPLNNCHLSHLKQKESYESVNADGNKYRDCLYIYKRCERWKWETLATDIFGGSKGVIYLFVSDVCGRARMWVRVHLRTGFYTHKYVHGYGNFQSCWNMSCIFCTLTCIELHMLYLSYCMRAQDYMSTFLVPSPKTLTHRTYVKTVM